MSQMIRNHHDSYRTVRWTTDMWWQSITFVDSYCRIFAGRQSEPEWWDSIAADGATEDYLDSTRRCMLVLGLPVRPLPARPTTALDSLARWFQGVAQAIEDSPLPDSEWTGLSETLGDLLPGLVGVSPSSVGRYRSGARPTPDLVAVRLHTIALIVTDLAGSYNDFGIRRWFTRTREALDGRRPADILSGEWDPDSDEVQRVRRLAGWLTGQVSDDPVPAR